MEYTSEKKSQHLNLGENSEIEIPIRLPQLSNSLIRYISGEIVDILQSARKKGFEIYTGFQ